MGWQEKILDVDSPVVEYLTEQIKQQRILIEWLLEKDLPNAQYLAIPNIERTLNCGDVQFASTSVDTIQRILDMIKEESTKLRNLTEERDRLIGTSLAEEVYCKEHDEFKENGNRWRKEDKNG